MTRSTPDALRSVKVIGTILEEKKHIMKIGTSEECHQPLQPLSSRSGNTTSEECHQPLQPLSSRSGNTTSEECHQPLQPLSSCSGNTTSEECHQPLQPLSSCSGNTTSEECHQPLQPLSSCSGNKTHINKNTGAYYKRTARQYHFPKIVQPLLDTALQHK